MSAAAGPVGDQPRRVPLGSWPTPLEPAPRLAEALGLRPGDLWIKRDDLTGLGGGGNKVRKLEVALALAEDAGATALVTTGAVQSNHARLTAAAAARTGRRAVLVLAGSPDAVDGSRRSGLGGSAGGQGNQVLDGLLGAEVVWAGEVDGAGLAARAEQETARLADEGTVAHLVPYGGSDPVTSRGYETAGREMLTQAPDLVHVVSAIGSGGTMAGLVAALGPARVLGVDTGATPDGRAAVHALLAGMPAPAPAAETLRVRSDQVGSGYAVLQPAVWDALLLAARTEGVVLDPVYTGRALAGLVAEAAEGRVRPGERTVLLHSGGLPGLFGAADAVQRALGELARGKADQGDADRG